MGGPAGRGCGQVVALHDGARYVGLALAAGQRATVPDTEPKALYAMVAMDLLEEIDVTDAADIAWVKASNNPAIWHEVAIAINAYCGDKHGFLSWLVQQPNMDRATAGWLLLNLPGTTYLREGNAHLHTQLPQGEFRHIMLELCERSEKLGFIEDKIGLAAIFEDRRQACLDIILNGEIGADRVAPMNILNRPFPKPRGDAPYEVHDGNVISVPFLKSILPDVYGD